jgi:hypothetical protein
MSKTSRSSSPSPEAVALNLGMLLEKHLSGGLADGRDMQRVLTIEDFAEVGVDPNAVDGSASRFQAIKQAKEEILRACSSLASQPEAGTANLSISQIQTVVLAGYQAALSDLQVVSGVSRETLMSADFRSMKEESITFEAKAALGRHQAAARARNS